MLLFYLLQTYFNPLSTEMWHSSIGIRFLTLSNPLDENNIGINGEPENISQNIVPWNVWINIERETVKGHCFCIAHGIFVDHYQSANVCLEVGRVCIGYYLRGEIDTGLISGFVLFMHELCHLILNSSYLDILKVSEGRIHFIKILKNVSLKLIRIYIFVIFIVHSLFCVTQFCCY